MISQIIDQLAFCHFYQNHFNVFYMKKEKPLPKTYCQNIREGFEKKKLPTFIPAIFEKWKEVLDNGRGFGALLVVF